MTDEEWFKDAACKGQPSSLFFPDRGEEITAAREICSYCVVRKECLDYAQRHRISFGVWGGKSDRERRNLRRKSGRKSRAA